EGRRGVVGEGGQGRRVANVDGPGEGAGDAEVGATPRGEGEPDALPVEGPGDRRSDPAARTGDESDLSLQAVHRFLLIVWMQPDVADSGGRDGGLGAGAVGP